MHNTIANSNFCVRKIKIKYIQTLKHELKVYYFLNDLTFLIIVRMFYYFAQLDEINDEKQGVNRVIIRS